MLYPNAFFTPNGYQAGSPASKNHHPHPNFFPGIAGLNWYLVTKHYDFFFKKYACVIFSLYITLFTKYTFFIKLNCLKFSPHVHFRQHQKKCPICLYYVMTFCNHRKKTPHKHLQLCENDISTLPTKHSLTSKINQRI